tara:strand:- start:416 stop:1102 length:687 start_codon:yes stop_codon:yes gene_type:complete
MLKIYNILIILFLIILPTSLNAHINHYNSLNRIEFDIYRNNKFIGKHIFSFQKADDQMTVESEINFKIKKLGVVLYQYQVKGTEIYKDNQLIKFNSKTNQNGKDKYVNMSLNNDKEYIIDGSSYKGKTSSKHELGTWWNHSIVKAKAQISAVSGRIIEQEVKFLGKEVLSFGNNTYNTLHFKFTSTDKKLDKDKKLNTHIWYDEETLFWVKASFEKKGKWEYKLVSIK